VLCTQVDAWAARFWRKSGKRCEGRRDRYEIVVLAEDQSGNMLEDGAFYPGGVVWIDEIAPGPPQRGQNQRILRSVCFFSFFNWSPSSVTAVRPSSLIQKIVIKLFAWWGIWLFQKCNLLLVITAVIRGVYKWGSLALSTLSRKRTWYVVPRELPKMYISSDAWL
jgi:hypothetical protein